jgi:hypothetical protein
MVPAPIKGTNLFKNANVAPVVSKKAGGRDGEYAEAH